MPTFKILWEVKWHTASTAETEYLTSIIYLIVTFWMLLWTRSWCFKNYAQIVLYSVGSKEVCRKQKPVILIIKAPKPKINSDGQIYTFFISKTGFKSEKKAGPTWKGTEKFREEFLLFLYSWYPSSPAQRWTPSAQQKEKPFSSIKKNYAHRITGGGNHQCSI